MPGNTQLRAMESEGRHELADLTRFDVSSTVDNRAERVSCVAMDDVFKGQTVACLSVVTNACLALIKTTS